MCSHLNNVVFVHALHDQAICLPCLRVHTSQHHSSTGHSANLYLLTLNTTHPSICLSTHVSVYLSLCPPVRPVLHPCLTPFQPRRPGHHHRHYHNIQVRSHALSTLLRTATFPHLFCSTRGSSRLFIVEKLYEMLLNPFCCCC